MYFIAWYSNSKSQYLLQFPFAFENNKFYANITGRYAQQTVPVRPDSNQQSDT